MVSEPCRWEEISNRMKEVGVVKDAENCRCKWDQEMCHYRKIHDYQGGSGTPDFFAICFEKRKKRKIPYCMRREAYDVFDELYGKEDESISLLICQKRKLGTRPPEEVLAAWRGALQTLVKPGDGKAFARRWASHGVKEKEKHSREGGHRHVRLHRRTRSRLDTCPRSGVSQAG
ncbi:hypothetical protein CBR_g34996 [Chara braunii]|uniref:Myb/SANT-like DNA-binding domain-containing protein n=1 Tax=Chara braunii TaxID=69332 RepID=A0A388LJX9_CHABU|nr:hypothetical protein CBR_g34996 [Chara braunii]|eukprot:GBG82626.1 hypothetical protein CBR_g34996 [Chara braunii]